MEKKIKIAMEQNKSIKIFVNDVPKHTIEESAREITAQEIYELLDYKSGDNFSVITENEKGIDEPVLQFFKELFDDICKRINEMKINEEEMDLKMAADNSLK